MKRILFVWLALFSGACGIAGYGAHFTQQSCEGQESVCDELNSTEPTGDACLVWACKDNPSLGKKTCQPVTVDSDSDGAPDPGCESDGQVADCRPEDNSIFPGAEELCDSIDNDCDTIIDEDAERIITANTYAIADTQATGIRYADIADSGNIVSLFFGSTNASPSVAFAMVLENFGAESPLTLNPINPDRANNTNAETTLENATELALAEYGNQFALASNKASVGNVHDVAIAGLANAISSGTECYASPCQTVVFDNDLFLNGFSLDTSLSVAQLSLGALSNRFLIATILSEAHCTADCTAPEHEAVGLYTASQNNNAEYLTPHDVTPVLLGDAGTPRKTTDDRGPAVLGVDGFGWLLAFADKDEQRIVIYKVTWDESNQELVPSSTWLFSSAKQNAVISDVALVQGPVSGNVHTLALAYRYGDDTNAIVVMELLELDTQSDSLVQTGLYEAENSPNATLPQRRPAVAWHSETLGWILGWDEVESSDSNYLITIRVNTSAEMVGSNRYELYKGSNADRSTYNIGAMNQGMMIKILEDGWGVFSYAEDAGQGNFVSARLSCVAP
ncbi:MAG: putative metal-binding motif-containing protein [Myxococcales bacterium]|nr:MAG: putative metal-binding motif-containing protein [Myxococcales bacterium]